MSMMSTFPYPVNFVLRYPEEWPELFSDLSPCLLPDPSSVHSRIQSNEECWIITTYLYLKRKISNVSISTRFIPGQINVVSSLDLCVRDTTFNSFIVGCRSDGFKPALCDFVIVQNQSQLESDNCAYIPHWPQPGLIPREKSRGNKVENIAYKGDANVNLYESFRSNEFRENLEKIGVSFKISGRPVNGPAAWHDYRYDDLVLAVRDLTERDLLVKPASKLVNAWLAGVPALLGPEPAFQSLKRSELDYIEVRSPQDALKAVQTLIENPLLYSQMVSNALERAKDYTVESMVDLWCSVLSGDVTKQYECWQRQRGMRKVTKFILRIPKHKYFIREAAYHRTHGYRVISGQQT